MSSTKKSCWVPRWVVTKWVTFKYGLGLQPLWERGKRNILLGEQASVDQVLADVLTDHRTPESAMLAAGLSDSRLLTLLGGLEADEGTFARFWASGRDIWAQAMQEAGLPAAFGEWLRRESSSVSKPTTPSAPSPRRRWPRVCTYLRASTAGVRAPALAHAAGEAARASYCLRGATDRNVLNRARTEAARASERLVADVRRGGGARAGPGRAGTRGRRGPGGHCPVVWDVAGWWRAGGWGRWWVLSWPLRAGRRSR